MADNSSERLHLALTALQKNKQSEAVSLITGLKPQAAQLCSKLELVKEKLTELEQSLCSQIHFLSFHIKTLEKKERATVISKSISESIQHTQYKKLQALKWDLMKARNALFIARKKLARRRRESSFTENGTPLTFSYNSSVQSIEELSASVQNIQDIVETLTKECAQKENAMTDTVHKIADLKGKLELQTHETNSMREISVTLQSRVKETKTLKLYTSQVIILWTLCLKAFDNGHTKEEVLSSIVKQANQISQQDAELAIEPLGSSRDLLKQLHFTPQCLLCCSLLLPANSPASFICEHCQGRDTTNKVVMGSFSCTEQGTIVGSVRVCNIAYDKQVFLRYSQDGWRHSNNQDAQYKHSEGNYDVFQFQLPFNISTSLYLEFAVCYRVSGVEFWDNNEGRNYKIAF